VAHPSEPVRDLPHGCLRVRECRPHGPKRRSPTSRPTARWRRCRASTGGPARPGCPGPGRPAGRPGRAWRTAGGAGPRGRAPTATRRSTGSGRTGRGRATPRGRRPRTGPLRSLFGKPGTSLRPGGDRGRTRHPGAENTLTARPWTWVDQQWQIGRFSYRISGDYAGSAGHGVRPMRLRSRISGHLRPIPGPGRGRARRCCQSAPLREETRGAGTAPGLRPRSHNQGRSGPGGRQRPVIANAVIPGRPGVCPENGPGG
jgi:hypothetical protein